MAAYEFTETRHPTAVYYDGTALTARASRASADSSGGWVDEVSSAGRIYVVLSGSDTPYNGVLQVVYTFRFANQAKIFNNVFYEARIDSLPNLSRRVEADFTGLSQIGGGSLSLANTDGFFNGLTDLQWDYGSTVLKMGIDYPAPGGGFTEMAIGTYETLGTWKNGAHDVSTDRFTLDLVETKDRLRNKIPLTVFDETTYPAADPKIYGKPIPLAYGVIYSAPAACINTSSRTFKLASHAIKSIDAVRYNDGNSGSWVEITPSSEDLTNAEFVLPGTWNGTDAVAVDFQGRKRSDGYLMTNGAEIVKDLLDQVGETTSTYDATSFTTAATAIQYGIILTVSAGSPYEVRGQPFLYIDTPTAVIDVISEINRCVNAYLFAAGDGKLYYKIFKPQPSEGLTKYDSGDILQGSFSLALDHTSVYSSILVRYAHRKAEDWAETYQTTDADINTVHAFGSNRVLTLDVNLVNRQDAIYWAQRQLQYRRNPAKTFRFTVPWKGMMLDPGDLVYLTYDEQGHTVDQVVEVLEQIANLEAGTVTVTAGDMHGIDRCGFVVAAAATLPARLGSGTDVWDDTWSDAIKKWAQLNVGYATDANGWADSIDPDSVKGSKVI
jgi:hypothetical protein